jgi:hypothetical protein
VLSAYSMTVPIFFPATCSIPIKNHGLYYARRLRYLLFINGDGGKITGSKTLTRTVLIKNGFLFGFQVRTIICKKFVGDLFKIHHQ